MNETKPKKTVSRNVAIALGIICILLIAIIAYFSITGISAQNSYNTLQNQNKQLQTWLDRNETLLTQTQTWLSGNESLLSQMQANNTNLQKQLNALFSGTPDDYGDQIYIATFMQGESGTWFVSNSVGSYTPGMTVQVDANQPTMIDVGVWLNTTSAGTLTKAYSNVMVNITVSGVVNNYPMIGRLGAGSLISDYWQLGFYWPSVDGSTAWTPPANASFAVTVQCQVYYSGSWNTIETWELLIVTGG